VPIRFLDGPPPPRKWGWSGIAAELRARPGVWAIIRERDEHGSVRRVDSAHAYLTKKGSPHMPITEYEFLRQDGVLYGRYLGRGED